MSAEIDAFIADFFAAFDNRSGPPATGHLRTLFLPAAIILKRSAAGAETMTVDSFIAPRAVLLTGGRLVDFHEWETEGSTSITGGVATRVSRYSKEGALDGARFSGAGVKHTSLVRMGDGWRIASLVWEDDA